jgi:branched-chain amino acid transport system substrate-binding protein
MRISLLAIMTALTTFTTATVTNAATIAIVAPQSGPYALLGQQVFEGARAAAEASGHSVVEFPESCEAGDSTELGARLADAGAVAAIGFLCTETLTDALPSLAEAKIPAITLAVRGKILMEDALREGWPLYRMAPAEGDEGQTMSEVIFARWKAEPIAIIDDGTIYGRELAGAVRQRIEAGGISPVFVDTYRPGQEQQVALVRRLQKAGASHVVVGGDRNDVAVIARDAEEENIPLTLLAGDTMRAADRPVALRPGVMAVATPDYAAFPQAADATTALRARDLEPEGYVLPAYAAVQAVDQALAEGGETDLSSAIGAGRFETVTGVITFNERHELSETPLRLQEWQDGRFVTTDTPTE